MKKIAKKFSFILFTLLAFTLTLAFTQENSSSSSIKAQKNNIADHKKDSALIDDSISNTGTEKAIVSQTTLPKKKTAIIVTLEETVDPGMAIYSRRAIKQAAAQKPDYIIFEVNTFGGELMAAFDIVDDISALDIPTIALVNKKAISAGALISLAATQVYMKPMTTIGDCAPVTQGADGMKMLGEKIQSPLRAKFRNLSQKNGFPELLGQAMVSIDLEIVKITKGDSIRFLETHEYKEMSEDEKKLWSTPKTMVKEGELLTLTNIEAEDLGFSMGTVENMDALVKKLQVTLKQEVEISWAEKLARLLRTLTPILTMIGFGAIYMEIKTPGFGIFGITGIVALTLAFGGQYIANVTATLPVVLMIIGMILVLIEIVILPGTMISGLSGAALMGVALIMVIKEATFLPGNFSPEMIDPHMKSLALKKAVLMVSASAVVALIFPIFATRYLLTRMPNRFSVVQNATLETSHTSRLDSDELKVGDIGVVTSTLRPTGKAKFNTSSGYELIEVQSRHRVIEKDQDVVIVQMNGNFITVDLAPSDDVQSKDDSSNAQDESNNTEEV